MSLLAQLRPFSFSMSEATATRSRAETYGLIAFGISSAVAAGLAFFPLSSIPSARPVTLFGTQAGPMSAFMNAAPFDPLRRAETSVGPLDAPVAVKPSDPFIIGGILINGNERKVMLSGAPGVWHSEGEEADGWLIRHIEPEQVIMTRGAEIKTPTYRAALETLGGGSPAAIQAPPASSPPPANPERPATPVRRVGAPPL